MIMGALNEMLSCLTCKASSIISFLKVAHLLRQTNWLLRRQVVSISECVVHY